MTEIFLTEQELEVLKMARNGNIGCSCVCLTVKKKQTLWQKIKNFFVQYEDEEPPANEEKEIIDNLVKIGFLTHKSTKKSEDELLSIFIKEIKLQRIIHIYEITDKGIEFLEKSGQDPKIVRLNVKKD